MEADNLGHEQSDMDLDLELTPLANDGTDIPLTRRRRKLTDKGCIYQANNVKRYWDKLGK